MCVSTARQGGAGSLLEDELGWKPVWWNTLPAGWGARSGQDLLWVRLARRSPGA